MYCKYVCVSRFVGVCLWSTCVYLYFCTYLYMFVYVCRYLYLLYMYVCVYISIYPKELKMSFFCLDLDGKINYIISNNRLIWCKYQNIEHLKLNLLDVLFKYIYSNYVWDNRFVAVYLWSMFVCVFVHIYICM